MKKPDKSTILIVDDKPANLLVLEGLLESPDRVLIRSTSGKDALTLAMNRNVDLIILDVQMPDIDGFEVARILKSNRKTRDIPIIFASAERKEHAFMLKGYEEGAIDYLFKPLDPEIAKAKVSVLLKVQMQKKELIEKNVLLERSALLINNSAHIIGIIDQATLKIEQVNHAFTEILGYALDEVVGTPLSFFLGNEDRLTVAALAKENKDSISFETRIYCKDRSIKYLQWNVVVKDRKWFVNARDITDIKQVERVRNYLATVVQQSKDAIYIHDEGGNIITWNDGAREMYGYTEEEAINMKIWNIIPEFLQTEAGVTVNKIIDGEKVNETETKRITRHGGLIDVVFSAKVISDSQTDLRSIAITERNITEQKRAQEEINQLHADLKSNIVQLEGANKELESFSYSVSHDLRAPLRILDGHSSILLEDYEEKLDGEARRLLNSIKNNVHKMNTLIDDLLEFARIGKKEVEKSMVNMTNVVNSAMNDIGYNPKEQNSIKLSSLLPVMADYALILQVWVNLISNALKYSSKKEKPLVEIGCNKGDNEIVYFIKDNGAGFDMKYADKLFGVFQRLHKAADFEGTGVGLATVQRVITKHGGRVWAESKVHEGATFYFSLPIAH